MGSIWFIGKGKKITGKGKGEGERKEKAKGGRDRDSDRMLLFPKVIVNTHMGRGRI